VGQCTQLKAGPRADAPTSSSPSDSPMNMISASGKVWLVEIFVRGHPERGRFVRVGWVRTGDVCDFSTYRPPYLRNGARRPRLLLNTNRKPHKRFRLVPKSTTSDDLELTLNGHYAFFTLHMCLSESTTKIWMKIDPYCQQQQCSPGIAVSTDIRYMYVRIFPGVRWGLGRGRQMKM